MNEYIIHPLLCNKIEANMNTFDALKCLDDEIVTLALSFCTFLLFNKVKHCSQEQNIISSGNNRLHLIKNTVSWMKSMVGKTVSEMKNISKMKNTFLYLDSHKLFMFTVKCIVII